MKKPIAYRVHWLSRITVGLLWVWHGLVPKLLFPETGELETLIASGLFVAYEENMIIIAGSLQVLFGLAIIVLPYRKWVHWVSMGSLAVLAILALFSMPVTWIEPHSPVTITSCMIVLSVLVISTQEALKKGKHE